MKRISVALATFNGERFLQEQLNSLAEQYVLPAELVVGDDGSEDATIAILERFASRSPFPVHIERNQTRLGYAGNFLRCTSRCSGDIIAFCDQDDIWLPHKLSTQLQHFSNSTTMLSTHAARYIDTDGRPLGRQPSPNTAQGDITLANSDPLRFASGFTQIVRRELLSFSHHWHVSRDDFRPHHSMAHDIWFFFLSLSLGAIKYEPDTLALYRQHNSNTSGQNAQQTRTDLAHRIGSNQVHQNRRMLDALNHRQFMLDIFIKDPTLRPWRSRLQSSSLIFKQAADRVERRNRLYEAPSLVCGVKQLYNNIRMADYASNDPTHFSYLGAVRDLALLLSLRLARRRADI